MLTSPQAPPAPRLTDSQVKDLLQRVDDDRDRFEDELDGKLKHSVLRGPNGEVDVEKFLDDLQENVDKMKGRYENDYSAGSEVATVLRQGSAVQRFMASQAPNMKGASEWNRLAGSLNELAIVYGTTFPTPDTAAVRRIGDHEIADAASKMADAADQVPQAARRRLEAGDAHSPGFPRGRCGPGQRLEEGCRRARGSPQGPQAGVRRSRRAAPAGGAYSRRPPPTLSLPSSATAAWKAVLPPLATIAHGFNLQPPQ